jgi:hypothetical protein
MADHLSKMEESNCAISDNTPNNMKPARTRQAIYLLIFLGTGLHLKAELWGSSDPGSLFSIGVLVWSLVPYFVIFILRKFSYGSLCAATLVFAFDLWMHLEAFVFPSSSTSALGLLFMPLWNLVLVIPVAYLVGSMISKRLAKRTKEK